MFTPDGNLLFVSKRPGAAEHDDTDEAASLWRLPAAGDAAKRAARKDAGVSAILHESLPVRHWDHDLGPGRDHLVAVDVATGERRVVAAADDDPASQRDYGEPAVSPDGRWVVFVDSRAESKERAPAVTLTLLDAQSDDRRDLQYYPTSRCGPWLPPPHGTGRRSTPPPTTPVTAPPGASISARAR